MEFGLGCPNIPRTKALIRNPSLPIFVWKSIIKCNRERNKNFVGCIQMGKQTHSTAEPWLIAEVGDASHSRRLLPLSGSRAPSQNSRGLRPSRPPEWLSAPLRRTRKGKGRKGPEGASLRAR